MLGSSQIAAVAQHKFIEYKNGAEEELDATHH